MKKYQGHIVDVIRREIFDGEVVVEEGLIKQVQQCELPDNGKTWPFLMPGFIDSHVHIESSMMTPSEFAHVASSHGTIGVVADPHEIGNVLGIEGIDYMIQSGYDATFNFCFAAPSCVPCCPPDIETSGAVIDGAAIEELMARDDIGVLGEMMNFHGVLNNDPEVMRKIRAAQKCGKPIDGHAPGLVGSDRERYALMGISTDHECATVEEGRACVSAGMKVIIREGSAAKDFDKLSPLIAESPNMVMFCTDDCHPDDLVRGHINMMVRRALAQRYDFWNIMMAASVNAQRHYRLNWGLMQEGDEATFIAVDSLDPHFRVLQTVIKGIEVYDCNTTFGSVHQHHVHLGTSDESYFPNRFEAKHIKEEDISLDVSELDMLHVMRAIDGSLYTGHDALKVRFNPFDGSRYPWGEVQKIVVLNRYQPDAKPVVGLVRGFSLTHGAIAGSVAHDCHNIVAIGSNDENIVRALNRVIDMRGGQVAVADDDMVDLALPIAGLMSPLSGHEVAYRCMLLCEMASKAGCKMRAPFITMAFLCLPVIPELKITDKYLWDSKNMRVVCTEGLSPCAHGL
jgi:adenine deaminase